MHDLSFAQGITHCEDGQLSQFGEHEADLTGLLQRILRHPQAVEHHSCGLPYGVHVSGHVSTCPDMWGHVNIIM